MKHEIDHRDVDHRHAAVDQRFVVLAQPAVLAPPAERAFNDQALRQQRLDQRPLCIRQVGRISRVHIPSIGPRGGFHTSSKFTVSTGCAGAHETMPECRQVTDERIKRATAGETKVVRKAVRAGGAREPTEHADPSAGRTEAHVDALESVSMGAEGFEPS